CKAVADPRPQRARKGTFGSAPCARPAADGTCFSFLFYLDGGIKQHWIWPRFWPIPFKELRINDQIRSSEVRLIDDQNNQLGVLSLDAALRIANEKGLDLVEVAPQASPPVCRLMDYGRYKFETVKREKDQRRKQNVIKLKEMKLRPKVAEHDFQTKFKGLRQFLEAGEKVKVTIMFRGREMVHQEIGRKILERVADDAKNFAVIERQPLLEGKNLFMILAPSRQGAAKEPAASA